MEQFANNPQSQLYGGIDSSNTTLTVDSASHFSTGPNFRILIGSEIMLVTGVSGAVFTVERAQEGTTGAAHNAGEPVTQLFTSGAIAALKYDILHSTFGASGTDHDVGTVPDPGATAGTTRFLREDAIWANVTIPLTAPVSPVNGEIWLDPTLPLLYAEIDDVTYPLALSVTNGEVDPDPPTSATVSPALVLNFDEYYFLSGQNESDETQVDVSMAAVNANYVLVGPISGSAMQPTFRSLVLTDIPNLPASQITSGELAIAQGGTGQSSASSAFNALAPTTTEGDLSYYHSSGNVRLGIGAAGTYLRSNGTDPAWSTIQGSDLPSGIPIPGTNGAFPQWVRYTINWNDAGIYVAANSVTVVLAAMGAGAGGVRSGYMAADTLVLSGNPYVYLYVGYNNAAGGGSSTSGIAGGYAYPQLLYPNMGAVYACYNYGSNWNVTVTLQTSNGANLNTATAGKVYIWLLVGVLP